MLDVKNVRCKEQTNIYIFFQCDNRNDEYKIIQSTHLQN